MDVHASPAELPELKAFLGAFQVRFRRPEGADALERYTTGLLTELPNKNCDTIAQAVPGTRCLVPGCDGLLYGDLPSREALWDSYYTAAPARLRQCVERYSIVKKV
jgi:hypothetical protein